THKGRFPVVMDVTSCTHSLQESRSYLTKDNQLKFDKLQIIDSIDYVHDIILPNISLSRKQNRIVLHPVCTLTKMGLQPKLLNIARHFSDHVDVPLSAGCCGMAGDRGFLFPELTKS